MLGTSVLFNQINIIPIIWCNDLKKEIYVYIYTLCFMDIWHASLLWRQISREDSRVRAKL